MITIALIALTSGISIFVFYNRHLFSKLSFNPYSLRNERQWYRIISYAAIHADWMHLAINMFVLYSFGRTVEIYYGLVFASKSTIYFLILYFGAVTFSIVPSWIKHRENPGYNSVGASGAVSAIVFASIIFQPLSKIYFFMIPIGIPAFIFGILYLIYSAYMAKKARDNIGHDAHFYGAVFGILFTIILKPALVLYFIQQLF